MSERSRAHWPRKRSRLSQEAGASLFANIRIRLTLWYCGVLGLALLLFSVALYLGTQYFLLNPVQNDTAMHAHAHAQEWVNVSQDHACSPPFSPDHSSPTPNPAPGFFRTEMVACFDQHGSLLVSPNTATLPTAFLSPKLAAIALQHGSASDTVNGGPSIGQIYRYAVAIPNPNGGGNIGVVITGESIQTQENALSLLLVLLVSVGGVSLLGAGLGGLFLANRAMAPARLAWANQQRFIADASHEMRTPLTLLRADAEVLLRGREHLASDDVALLEDIVAETNHMSTIATNMLTLARLDNTSFHREHEVVNLSDLARQGASRVQALAAQLGITIQSEIDSTPFVIGDPTLLEQALLVLLDNAIKYNQSGGQVSIRTTVQGEQALLAVHDTGIGIPAEHLPHLGERFYRVDKARSREAGGTGLGLSIARGTALAHEGQLSISSTPGQGTTVTLMLPLASGTVPAKASSEVL